MADKDLTEKTLEAYGDVFADIVNGLLFQGEQILLEQSLTDAQPFSMYKTDGKLHEQDRDVAKYWMSQNGEMINVRLAFLGIENQTQYDKDMPLRVIGYDGAAYRGEIGQEDRYPVVTLVLYFGEKSWSGPRCLSDLVNVPEELNPYFNDYRLNIAEVALLEEEQLAWFHSDFYMVAEYFVKKRIYGKSYQPSSQHIKHVDEFLKLMAVLTKDSNWTSLPEEIKERKGGVSMCDVLEYREEKGIEKGIEKGKDQLSLKAEELKKAGKSAEEILSTLFPKLNYSKE